MRKPNRNVVRCDAARSPANPFLIYVAVTLLTILAICAADRHRDFLMQIGVTLNDQGLDPRFVGP